MAGSHRGWIACNLHGLDARACGRSAIRGCSDDQSVRRWWRRV